MDDETLAALRDILDYIERDETEGGWLGYDAYQQQQQHLKDCAAKVRQWMDG